MTKTHADGSFSDQSSSKKQHSFRSSSRLYQKAFMLYQELGIPLSTALSIFFAGTVSARSLPFSPSQNCARFLEIRAHRDLLNMRGTLPAMQEIFSNMQEKERARD